MHYGGDYDLSGPHPTPHKAPGLAQQWHWECWWHNSSPPHTNVTVTMSIWFLWLVLFFISQFFGYLNLFLIVHYFMSLITYKKDPNWLHPSCSLSAIKLSLKVLDSGKKWEEWNTDQSDSHLITDDEYVFYPLKYSSLDFLLSTFLKMT